MALNVWLLNLICIRNLRMYEKLFDLPLRELVGDALEANASYRRNRFGPRRDFESIWSQEKLGNIELDILCFVENYQA